MRLRYKLNLVGCGFCACGALIGAMAHAPSILLINLVLSYLNWTVALAGETKDNEVKED